jgi:hypothetical protein
MTEGWNWVPESQETQQTQKTQQSQAESTKQRHFNPIEAAALNGAKKLYETARRRAAEDRSEPIKHSRHAETGMSRRKWFGRLAGETAALMAVGGGTLAFGAYFVPRQQAELSGSIGAEAALHVKNFDLVDGMWRGRSHNIKDAPATVELQLEDGSDCTLNYHTYPSPASGWFSKYILSHVPADIDDNKISIVPNADDPNISGTCELISHHEPKRHN